MQEPAGLALLCLFSLGIRGPGRLSSRILWAGDQVHIRMISAQSVPWANFMWVKLGRVAGQDGPCYGP